MRTSVLLPPSLTCSSSRNLVAWVRAAEDAGVDTIGVYGRVVRDSLEPLVALTLVAATSRRAELVLHLNVPALARPSILERQIAGLKRTSRGRLTVNDSGSAPEYRSDLELVLSRAALVPL
jgi:alkanesulfonate monooxygenase SsuD/methylene tetrahydromethanopterin reductase-like flavin-dependent oxidoreductase (luciferase family)